MAVYGLPLECNVGHGCPRPCFLAVRSATVSSSFLQPLAASLLQVKLAATGIRIRDPCSACLAAVQLDGSESRGAERESGQAVAGGIAERWCQCAKGIAGTGPLHQAESLVAGFGRSWQTAPVAPGFRGEELLDCATLQFLTMQHKAQAAGCVTDIQMDATAKMVQTRKGLLLENGVHSG